MKRVIWVLFGFLFFLSCAGHAQEQIAANDLTVRLAAELETFKQDIATLRGDQLIKSADLLTGSGLSDPALYSIVEEKTKFLMSEHSAKPNDKNVAEELNGMIRALGSMSVSSFDIIKGLVESSSSRGVRNRAHRLHPKLYWFANRNAIMQRPDFYQPGQDLMTHRYLNLLSSSDSSLGLWALQELERRGGAEPIVYNKMREILATQKTSIQNATQLDYLAWICKLLSRYDATNSAELLQSIKNDPSQDKNTKKLKKYVRI